MTFLSYLSEYMIPLLIFFIVLNGVFARKNVYEDFMKGARDGLSLVIKIMPTMISMMVAVNVFRASGLLEMITELVKPLADCIHFPAQILPLAVMKTVSGSGATGLLLDLFKEYGTDSYIGKVSSIMLSSTETIFYTMSLYFVTAGIKKTRYTLAGCLLASVSGIAASIFLARYM